MALNYKLHFRTNFLWRFQDAVACFRFHAGPCCKSDRRVSLCRDGCRRRTGRGPGHGLQAGGRRGGRVRPRCRGILPRATTRRSGPAPTTGPRARRKALLAALRTRAARAAGGAATRAAAGADAQRATVRALGRVEVSPAKALLSYARDVQTGILSLPASIAASCGRCRIATGCLPGRFRHGRIRRRVPQGAAAAIQRIPAPDEGKVATGKRRLPGRLGPARAGARAGTGGRGAAVVALRDRLIAMGYLPRNARRTYDAHMQRAVQASRRSRAGGRRHRRGQHARGE